MPVKKVQSSKLKVKSSGAKIAVKVALKGSKYNVPVYGLSGTKKGSVDLPKEIFGAKINERLMAQAVRVYLINQRQGTASTKTRGEVTGSTRKIYRQKGTGRARHGSIKAPIFVGGGIVFGPRPRKFELKLSKQMRRKALFSALSQKLLEQKVSVIDSKGASGKTHEFAKLFRKLAVNQALFVSDLNLEAKRAVRNIRGITAVAADSINTYEVLSNKHVIFAKDAIPNLINHFLKKENNL
jgi:large subunit ribosomal protein L4